MRSKGLLGVVVITLVYACPAPAYKAVTQNKFNWLSMVSDQ
jgi:hypothetical protein